MSSLTCRNCYHFGLCPNDIPYKMLCCPYYVFSEIKRREKIVIENEMIFRNKWSSRHPKSKGKQ